MRLDAVLLTGRRGNLNPDSGEFPVFFAAIVITRREEGHLKQKLENDPADD